MSRIALGLAYDGSAWQGWQTQPHRATVQDTFERALASFARVPIATVCAGRTDARVHAAMQVVHLDTDLDRRLESWVRGVNTFLPLSIAVQWAQSVPDTFHARFSATSRSYTYVLWRGRARPALWCGRVGWTHAEIDVHAMRQSALSLIGEHDFSSFRSSQCQAKHPIRKLTHLDIVERGAFLIFTLRANAFLHHMVRNLIGALLQVGMHKETVAWIGELLRVRDRTQGAPTFMPDGLYLASVGYPEHFELTEADGSTRLLAPFATA